MMAIYTMYEYSLFSATKDYFFGCRKYTWKKKLTSNRKKTIKNGKDVLVCLQLISTLTEGHICFAEIFDSKHVHRVICAINTNQKDSTDGMH